MTVCLEGKCSIQLSYGRIQLPAASYPGPVVSPVSGCWHRGGSVRTPNVSLIKPIPIAVSALPSVYLVQGRTVSLGFTAFTVLAILFFVVTLFKPHNANVQKWTHIYPTHKSGHIYTLTFLVPCMPSCSFLNFCFWTAWF